MFTSDLDRRLLKAGCALLAGQIVAFFASMGLLDRQPVVLLSFFLLLGPLIFRYIAVRTTWGQLHQKSTQSVFRWAIILLAVMDAAVIANRSLDREPAAQTHVNVIAKHSHSGKGGEDYTLLVGPSWRSGRHYESLDVGKDTFSRASVGGMVSIDLHAGFFRLPWYNNVRPDLTRHLELIHV